MWRKGWNDLILLILSCAIVLVSFSSFNFWNQVSVHSGSEPGEFAIVVASVDYILQFAITPFKVSEESSSNPSNDLDAIPTLDFATGGVAESAFFEVFQVQGGEIQGASQFSQVNHQTWLMHFGISHIRFYTCMYVSCCFGAFFPKGNSVDR